MRAVLIRMSYESLLVLLPKDKYVFFPPKVWNLKVLVVMETKKLIGKPLQPARPARHLASPPGEYVELRPVNGHWSTATSCCKGYMTDSDGSWWVF